MISNRGAIDFEFGGGALEQVLVAQLHSLFSEQLRHGQGPTGLTELRYC